jgi:DNA polymerase III subunit gamma/tau
MEYQVTARKWRPKKFDEVVGQEHITSTLKNALKSGRIAHAFLFTGPRGVGKTTTARILAKSLNCENLRDYEPCNECSMCESISNSQTMDIIEIDAASNRGIDEIRTLRESVKYTPTRGKYKVYIIDEVHMLTKESFNAFLKTLEEPPAHTIFIFATTDVHKLPLTIISRCQRFDFRRIQLDVIKEQLSMIAKSEGINIDDKTLTIISKKADGALRDAESYFDQVIAFCGTKIDFETVSKMLNLIDEELYFKISDAILIKDFKAVFETTEILYKNGWDFIDFLDGLAEHFRNILTTNVTQKTDLIESAEVFRKKYVEYLNSFTKGDLLRILNYTNKVQQDIRFSQNQRLKIEIALTHLIGMEKSHTLNELLFSVDAGQEVATQSNILFTTQKKNLIDGKANLSYTEQPAPISEKKSDLLPNTGTLGKKQSLPASRSEDFENISLKWQTLIDLVQQERSLLLGNLFSNLHLVDYRGQDLTLAATSEQIESDFSLHKDYIEKKIVQIFGKKLNLKFSVLKEIRSYKKPPKASPKDHSDPVEKMIIEELGAEEIA